MTSKPAAAATTAPAADPLRHWRFASYLLPALVLAASLSVSWWLREQERLRVEQVVQNDFDTRVRETAGIFRERILGCEQALHATAGLFAASTTVETAEFRAFVGRFNVSHLPGLQGIGFARTLEGSTASRTAFFEPPDRRLSIVGSDPFAEPSRRPAMMTARDSGAVAIANKQKLPEEDADAIQGGYRMYLPIYRNGADTASVAARRANLIGWVYAAFRMDGLTANIIGERNDAVIDVYDGDDMADQTLLLDTSRDRVGGESELKLLRRTVPIEVGGYAWTLSAKALPNFATPLALSDLRWQNRVGLAASLLLTWVTWLGLRRRIRTLRMQEDLRSAKQRAEEANVAKSRFLAAASHDLRQPIHALGLFVAALHSMTRRAPMDGEEVARIAARLKAALDMLGSLLDALLDISRLDAGTVAVNRRAVAINDVLAAVYETFAGPAEEKGLALRVVPSSLWAETDPVLLQRILGNLVANAVRYTKRGGILIGCRRRGDEFIVQVWDSGIGIAPDQLEAIFTEFYQVGAAARDREQGLGLGLAIVRRLADLLGARINVVSRPGKGSAFSVALRRAGAPVATESSAAHPDDVQWRALTVLAVDDDTAVLDAVRTLLTNWGHTVLPASSVAEAEAIAQTAADIDLILADYHLADDATGIDAIEAVRARVGRRIPAAIVSGDCSPQRLREIGADELPLLNKPLDLQELQLLLESCFSPLHAASGAQ